MSVAGRILIVGSALGATLLVCCSSPPQTSADKAATVPAEVMVAYQPAQLCPSPKACLAGDEVAWVDPGTTLEVLELQIAEMPRSKVHWFRVENEGRSGWINEFSTDKAPRVRGGKLVRE